MSAPDAQRYRDGTAFFVRRMLAVAMLATITITLTAGPGQAQAAAQAWTVFQDADGGLPMGDHLLANAGFELGESNRADSWRNYGAGYSVDETGGRRGSRALKLVSTRPRATQGASTVITVNQTEPTPLFFSGWSRALDVTGDVDANYSVYLDIRYADDTPLYGQTLRYAVGTHAWQYLEGFILPEKPVASISVYCLLRSTHTGTVWFDDLTIREVHAEILSFDGRTVATVAPSSPPYGAPVRSVGSDDGISLGVSGVGGAITSVILDESEVVQPNRSYGGGFLLRDVAAGGDVVHVGGEAVDHGLHTIVHESNISELDIVFQASYTGTKDRIEVRAEIEDTSGVDRAVTVYFALPVEAVGWQWGDDVRATRPITGVAELANLTQRSRLGSNGHTSKYPWAAIAGREGGMAIGVPLDSPRVMRLAHNPVTDQFYAAFDVGLSRHTAAFPSKAWVDLVLYRFEPDWGFRSAAKGYYERYPASFSRRIPPDEEGIWVAFSDLSKVPDVDEFGIAFHELGAMGQIDFDETAGIQSYRYLSEPWSHWLRIDDKDVDPTDYDQTYAYLQARTVAGDKRSEATLNSGFHDDEGRLRYVSTVRPWCSGLAGCAVFYVNPDPDIRHPVDSLNKGKLDWSDADRTTYDRTPDLDGEYIDSYLGGAGVLDFREEHFAATDTPLTFRASDGRVGVPQIFATTEFARWVTTDVHEELGKRTMANGILLDVPWGADLFDIMGRETNWIKGGSFVPDSDATLSYQRTLAHQRPYALLMNTDFADMTHAFVEAYFKATMFYGIYPSMFSHDAATDRYWDDPELYERDRPLFRRYVPWIRALNRRGWRPVTHVRTSDDRVIVERYGQWPDMQLAVRNVSATDTVTASLRFDARSLGLPRGDLTLDAVVSADRFGLTASDDDWHETSIVMPAQHTEILSLRGFSVQLPLAIARRVP